MDTILVVDDKEQVEERMELLRVEDFEPLLTYNRESAEDKQQLRTY